MALIAQYQQGVFTAPANGQDGDATVVLSNDNNVRSKHNSHDADPTIHWQSSTLASRPAAGTADRIWLTTDGLRVYRDSGSAWQEVDYLNKAAGGTVTGATTFSNGITITTSGLTVSAGTTAVQAFTATTGSFSSTVTFTAAASKIVPGATSFSHRNNADSADNLLISDAGVVTVRAGFTVTAGTSSLQATTIGAALTYGGVTLSNAVTGTGKMVLDTSPTFLTAITLPATIQLANSAVISNSNNITITANSTICAFFGAATVGSIQFPNLGTTASAANAFLDSGNAERLLRSTSSIRYKTDVRPLSLRDSLRIVRGAQPVWYRSKAEADDRRKRHLGLIAEREAKNERALVHLVHGRPDGVQYERYVAPLLRVVASHDDVLRSHAREILALRRQVRRLQRAA